IRAERHRPDVADLRTKRRTDLTAAGVAELDRSVLGAACHPPRIGAECNAHHAAIVRSRGPQPPAAGAFPEADFAGCRAGGQTGSVRAVGDRAAFAKLMFEPAKLGAGCQIVKREDALDVNGYQLPSSR